MKVELHEKQKILYFIALVACILILQGMKQHSEKNIEIRIQEDQAIIENLMAYEESLSTLKTLQQNHCYTKDIKLGNFGLTTLRLSTGQFIRGVDAFPLVKQKNKIKRFKKPVTYLCALGIYNYQSPLFFPTQNFYLLPETEGERLQFQERLSRDRETQLLSFDKDNKSR